MIRATYLTPGTGEERPVEVLSASKETKTAEVSPLDWRGSGWWWDNTPKWHVDQFSLLDIRVVCPACGEEFDPAGTCSCGYDWRTSPTDQEDAEATQEQLKSFFRGG